MYHAVVALASLHETFNSSTDYKPGSDQYGLRQYNKSLAGLNRYIATAKDKSVDIVLICCILFITFESLHGDYGTILKHLQGGLKILSSSQLDPRSSKFINDDILPIFSRLYVQVTSIINTDILLSDLTTRAVCVPKRFSSLDEARNTCYSIMSLISDFSRVVDSDLEKGEVRSEKPGEILLEQQAYYASLLEQWHAGFDALIEQLSTSMDSKDLCGKILLEIHYTTAATMLDVALTHLQCHFDRLLPQFQRIVSLAKSFIEATEATGVILEKHLLWVDMGIIAPLFFVATSCRDPLLRREAARLLSSPRREGTWDAQAAATIAKRVIVLEEEGLHHVNVAQDVPESSRIYAFRPTKIDLATHQVKLVFHHNAIELGDDTCTFEERLIW